MCSRNLKQAWVNCTGRAARLNHANTWKLWRTRHCTHTDTHTCSLCLGFHPDQSTTQTYARLLPRCSSWAIWPPPCQGCALHAPRHASSPVIPPAPFPRFANEVLLARCAIMVRVHRVFAPPYVSANSRSGSRSDVRSVCTVAAKQRGRDVHIS